MTGIRTATYQTDQIRMETTQTIWNRGAVIALSTIEVQAGRLSTAPADEIRGVYFGALPADITSLFGTDQLPLLALSGTGIPVLVQAAETIAVNDYLTASSVTPGTVRTAAGTENRIGRAITAILSGGLTNLVMVDLFQRGQFAPP